jgi:hypothetical protein
MPSREKPVPEGTPRIGIYIVSSLMRRAKAAVLTKDAALTAVILSAFSVEAFTNAFLDAAYNLTDPAERIERLHVLVATIQVNGLRDPTDRKRLKLKLDMIAHVLGGERPLFDHEPFQALNWLLEALNLLAHGRLEYLDLTPDRAVPVTYDDLLREISTRANLPAPHTVPLPTVVDFLDQPDVARWAFNTAQRVVAEVLGWLPAGTLREKLPSLMGIPGPLVA